MPAPPLPPTAARDARRRVLLVDADAATRTALAAHLRAHGYLVDERAALPELAAALHDDFAALVADTGCASALGGPALAHWRQLAPAPVPVVVLQRNADPADRIVTLELGADVVLSKPVHAPELRLRLDRLVARRESRRFAGPRLLTPRQATALRAWRGLGPLLHALDAPDAARAPDAPDAPDAPAAPDAPDAPRARRAPATARLSDPADVARDGGGEPVRRPAIPGSTRPSPAPRKDLP